MAPKELATLTPKYTDDLILNNLCFYAGHSLGQKYDYKEAFDEIRLVSMRLSAMANFRPVTGSHFEATRA